MNVIIHCFELISFFVVQTALRLKQRNRIISPDKECHNCHKVCRGTNNLNKHVETHGKASWKKGMAVRFLHSK